MEHKDKHIEALIDRIMADGALESPSPDFTDKVMKKVLTLPSEATVYKPLISKPVWAIIFILLFVLIGYILSNRSTVEPGWINQLGLDKINMNPFSAIDMDFSSVFMYAMLLLVVMMGIQIPLLKHYFNQRLVIN